MFIIGEMCYKKLGHILIMYLHLRIIEFKIIWWLFDIVENYWVIDYCNKSLCLLVLIPSTIVLCTGSINNNISKNMSYISLLFQGQEQRNVVQLHFTVWPDHGVPDDPTSLLNYRRRVAENIIPGKPTLVHCRYM